MEDEILTAVEAGVQPLSETPTIEELAERVAALENVAEETLGYSAQEIDDICDIVTMRDFTAGRSEIIVSGKQVSATVSLSLGFTPTTSTMVLATVRKDDAPSPYENFCLNLRLNSSQMYAQLTMGPNVTGPTFVSYLPLGKYYIDWLVIRR